MGVSVALVTQESAARDKKEYYQGYVGPELMAQGDGEMVLGSGVSEHVHGVPQQERAMMPPP